MQKAFFLFNGILASLSHYGMLTSHRPILQPDAVREIDPRTWSDGRVRPLKVHPPGSAYPVRLHVV